MLKVVQLSSPSEKQVWIRDFDFRQKTWIVSDLKAKLTLQKHGLERHGALTADSVIRIGELWRHLVFRKDPTLRVLSAELVRRILKSKLQKRDELWCRRPGASSALLNLANQCSSALFHPEGYERLGDFFRRHPESYLKWGSWFVEAHRFTLDLLQDGFLASPWLSAYLLHSDGALNWGRDLVVDVGADLTETEAELLGRMGRDQEVVVLVPVCQNPRDSKYSLKAYRHLDGFRETPAGTLKSGKTTILDDHRGERRQVELDSLRPNSNNGDGYRRFTTMLAEVKDAVATARKWADSGTALDRIAIVAPDIGVYWPVLKRYLQEEGLPTDRGLRVPLQTFLPIQRWLSWLRIEAGTVGTEDLETVAYSSSSQPLISYDEFVRLYGRIDEVQDLGRHRSIQDLFRKKFSSKGQVLEREDFAVWALSFCEANSEAYRIEGVIKTLLTECPTGIRFSLEDWVAYLETLCGESEVSIESGQSLGVACVDLASAEYLFSEKLYFLGLSETGLNPVGRGGGMATDVDRIESETGFVFPHPDRDRLEFELRWLSRSHTSQKVYSFSATDFQGAILAPSIFFLSGSQEHSPQAPAETRWDEIQRSGLSTIAHLRGWDPTWSESVRSQIRLDLGEESMPQFAANRLTSISASHLENYAKCPFIYAATRLFRMEDPTPLDLDLDSKTHGTLAHAMVEKIVSSNRWDWRDDEILDLIDQCRLEEDILIADQDLWQNSRRKFLVLARRFLNFEVEWRKKFQKTQSQKLEVVFEGSLSSETGALLGPAKEGISIRGKIDRVDTNGEGQALVIDYKAGGSSHLSSIGNWVKEGSFQLAIYSQAVEMGLVPELEGVEVVSATYLSLKEMRRVGGFRRTSRAGDLFDCDDGRHDQVSDEARDQTFSEIREAIRMTLQNIRSGQFAPQPRDPEICKTCSWSRLCRAPHLN